MKTDSHKQTVDVEKFELTMVETVSDKGENCGYTDVVRGRIDSGAELGEGLSGLSIRRECRWGETRLDAITC